MSLKKIYEWFSMIAEAPT